MAWAKQASKSNSWSDGDFKYLNTVWVYSFSIGLILNGWFIDNKNPKNCLTFALFGTGFLNGIIYYFAKISYTQQNVYYGLSIVDGFVFSFAFPSIAVVLGNWFKKYQRGKVIALFSFSHICGAWLGELLVDKTTQRWDILSWIIDLTISTMVLVMVGIAS